MWRKTKDQAECVTKIIDHFLDNNTKKGSKRFYKETDLCVAKQDTIYNAISNILNETCTQKVGTSTVATTQGEAF